MCASPHCGHRPLPGYSLPTRSAGGRDIEAGGGAALLQAVVVMMLHLEGGVAVVTLQGPLVPSASRWIRQPYSVGFKSRGRLFIRQSDAAVTF